MTKEREYVSPDRALVETRVPFENHTFIKDFLHRMGIERVRVVGNYIVADRPEGGPSLNIHNGSSNGFLSEDEIDRVVGGDVRRGPSEEGGRGWRIIHPLDPEGRESGPMSGATAKRRGGQCPECGFELSLAGTCSNPYCQRYG